MKTHSTRVFFDYELSGLCGQGQLGSERHAAMPTETLDMTADRAGIPFQVLATGSEEMLNRPCVDCGLVTGSFCDYCEAADRCPDEEWAAHQMTPLCTKCDRKWNACHFCRGQQWCVPKTHR